MTFRPLSKGASRRGALAVTAVTGVALLAACGGTTQPAAGGTAGSAASGSSGSSDSSTKTLVFSPLGLQIPAMKQLSEGVQAYAKSKGFTVIVQDPHLDAQKQITDLQSVVESHRADAVWAIMVQPSSAKALVKTAQSAHIPMLLNGVPSDYGLSSGATGVTFDTIDYKAVGQAVGENLGKCINEKLGGKATVIMEANSPGTAGKADIENTAKSALTATAPGAKIVSTVVVNDRTQAQTDIGAALQGNPNANAVMGNNDEGALGGIGAFKAAGKKLTCLVEGAGGNDESLKAVKSGDIYAVIALQFADDMTQSVDTLSTMLGDATAAGKQLTVPQKVIKG